MQESLFASIKDYRKKFMFLDIETTHLDMREGKIMEIGAVEAELFFDQDKNNVQIKFGEKFDTLVNPEIEPSVAALSITNIAKQDLLKAPAWKEVRPKLQDFLKNKTLVGHNLFFDLSYLQNEGLELKNDYLDTLEIAQTFVPLLASHSLEFLAEEFAVIEGAPHRALQDSIHTASVLGRILNEYLKFPQKLKKELNDLLSKSKLSFKDLFLDLPAIAGNLEKKAKSVPQKIGRQKLAVSLPQAWANKTIYCLPFAFSSQELWLQDLAGEEKSLAVGAAHEFYLQSLPPEPCFFDPQWSLCERRASFLLGQENLPDIAIKMFIKILVAQELPGQLNFSRIRWTREERDYLDALLVKPEICASHSCQFSQSLPFADQKTRFFSLAALFAICSSWNIDFSKIALAAFDLSSVEENFTESLTETWNLRRIRSALSSFYPLNKINLCFSQTLAPEAEQIANELDLFFGILHLSYLKKEGEYSQNLVVDDAEFSGHRFQNLMGPAQKLSLKLESFAGYLDSRIIMESEDLKNELIYLRSQIKKFMEFIKNFFLTQNGENVRWLKFNADRVDMNLLPRDISGPFAEILRKFKSVSFIDTSLPKLSLRYFQNRLGITNYQVETLAGEPAAKIPVTIFSESQFKQKLIGFLLSLPGSTIAVLPNESMLGEYFTELVKNPKPGLQIIAHKYSGNVSALRTKAAKSEKFLFLATTNALSRFWPRLPSAKNLLIFRLPFEPSHAKPSMLGLEPREAFPNHVLPRAVQLLHRMICKFLSSAGEEPEIYLLDPRILTDYDREFLNYLEEFPDFSISTREMY